MKIAIPLLARFESKYRPDPSGCWIWTGRIRPDGYADVSVGSRPEKNRTRVLAHRLSWTLHRGEIPDGLCVLHTCDVRNCVNPDHLWLGTYADNMADMVAKGRQGERVRRGRLTAEQARSIANDSRSARELAEFYGVAKATIFSVKHRRNWAHLWP